VSHSDSLRLGALRVSGIIVSEMKKNITGNNHQHPTFPNSLTFDKNRTEITGKIQKKQDETIGKTMFSIDK
jgi:hypothetical protein